MPVTLTDEILLKNKDVKISSLEKMWTNANFLQSKKTRRQKQTRVELANFPRICTAI
jgi:predicted double-glycine peptidase